MRRRVSAAESATAATCGRLLGEAAAAEGKVRKFGTFGRRGILYLRLRSFLSAFAVDAALQKTSLRARQGRRRASPRQYGEGVCCIPNKGNYMILYSA